MGGLEKLTHLELIRTKVTDKGLKALSGHKNLTYLSLGSTEVTDLGVAKLRKALPRCELQRVDYRW